MEVIYRVNYNRQAVREDIPRLSATVKKRIASAIDQKLQTRPELYGHPLRGSLVGYWKLRVGDYRIVYSIQGQEVFIEGIQHRSNIYSDVKKRLS